MGNAKEDSRRWSLTLSVRLSFPSRSHVIVLDLGLRGRCSESNEARQTILSQDLNLTNQSLKLNPKNYSVWEHRKWVLVTMTDADWSMEMKMVELYLEKDGRNCLSSSLSSPVSHSLTL